MERIEPLEAPPHLVPAAVVILENPRHAQAALRVANLIYPLDSACEHLKRIRRSQADSSPRDGVHGACAPRLELLLVVRHDSASLAPHGTFDEDAGELLGDRFDTFLEALARASLPAAEPTPVMTALKSSLAPHVVGVASHAPRQSPESWEHWNAVWPLAFPKPPAYGLISESVQACVRAVVMTQLLPLAARSASAARDGNDWFPLMSCPATAALLWDPVGMSVVASTEGYCGAVHDTVTTTGLIAEHPITFALKQLAQRQVHRGKARDVEDGFDSATPADSLHQKPYLANGLELFVTDEPCVMCAMALIHSRIERVVYLRRNHVHGGLGSCFHVHAMPSLNHHFEVLYLPRETLQPQ